MTAPYSDFPLPVRVLELDVADGVSSITGCEGYGSVRLLVRRHGTPLGWVNLKGARAIIPSEEIVAAVHRRLHGACVRETVLQRIGRVPRTERWPAISVVVCTRDRAHQLERCLRALARLEYPRYEIVVVDNAPTSGTTEQVAVSAGVRYVVERCPGLDWARNRGMAAARHDIIAYTDDDTEADSRWLRGIAAGFRDPSVGAVTGLVIPGAMDTEAEVLFELCYGGMGKGTSPRLWDPTAMSSMDLIGSHHVGVGANMAFRRNLLSQLGGFETALDVGTPANGGGDLDIFHRALMAGTVVRYQPAAMVRHFHRSGMAALRQQHYDNGRAFGVYLLTVFRRGAIPRLTTLRYAVRIWLTWMVGRMVRRLLRKELLPMPLLLAELWGATHAPLAYLATFRSDRARRKQYSNPEVPERA